MSSRRGGGKPFNSGANGEPSPKGKNEHDANSSKVEQQLSHGVAGISLESAQDDGQWEVISRKSKNRAGSSSAKAHVSQNSNHKAWGHTDVGQKPGWVPGNTWQTQVTDSKRPAGRGNVRTQLSARHAQSNYVTPQPVIRPPLEHGWNWQSRAASNQPKGEEDGQGKVEAVSNVHTGEDIEADKDNYINDVDDDDDDDDDDLDDSDDELLTDEFDSDSSEKSFGTRKNNKWFRKFFEIMDSLPLNDINDPARQWHCPACKGGPGAIDWYRGLQPLITHAKTKGSQRVKLHREFAELLEEDLQRRGTSVVPAGEAFGKWKGLIDEGKDHDIVWPPMVVIMNTRLEQDENEKWIGMGNQELLDYFSSYDAAKARHSYGPQGHRGMSMLIFEASAGGYLEAERLHKHFAEQGTDRNAWDRRRSMFHPGGERQLYGYLAVKEDLDIFNQHSQGKSKLKFEMRSYHEMVVNQIKQMSEDNQLLIWLKNRNAKQEMANKTLQENFGILSEKLRKTMEENRIVRQRTKMQHEENKEEMYMQEQFFKDQIKVIHESRDAKEEKFEMLQQEEREKVKQANSVPSNAEEYRRRAEEIAKFIKIQEKEVEEFVLERDVLIKAHEDKMAAMRKRHWEEEVELEKEFDANLNKLMEKYTPHHPAHTAKAI